MGKLTIQEVAKVLIAKNGLKQNDANRFATEFFAVIMQQLQQGEQVKVKGFGTFKIINVEARESVSVRTGERVLINGHSKVTFVPDIVMKELVNKPFSHFETVVLNDGVEFDDIVESEKSEEVRLSVPVDVAIKTEPNVDEQETATEEPISEIIEETKTKEQPAEEQKSVVEEDTEQDENVIGSEEDDKRPWWSWMLACLGILLLMGLSAYVGYKYGHMQNSVVPSVKVVTDTIYMAEPLDSVYNEEYDALEDAIPEEQTRPILNADETYSQRLRGGAYRIVGTDKEIVVEKGMTFYSICRSNIGTDKQIYVEVYNNLPKDPEIKVGQIIKIPKLERK
ncbi:MAG: HU family DNA-binding protein [Prevotella sp.]|nr:HU family DNA-binding protein [Prevotella sp.]